MRKLLSTGLFVVFTFLTLCAQGRVNPNYHYVQPHQRSDGTIVKGHMRTNPNSTNRDNYSTLGNTNPWTGQQGWIPPDNKPSPSNYIPSYTPSTYTSFNKPPSNQKNTSPTLDKIVIDDEYPTFRSTPASTNSSYTNTSPPSYRTLNWSAGRRVVNYLDGREEFNVTILTKPVFNKSLTYFSFDPYNNEIKETTGGADSKLLLDGTYRFYDKVGTLQKEENYRNGLKHGASATYDENGVITDKAQYSSGRPTYRKFTTEEGTTFEIFGELKKVGTKLQLHKQGALFKNVETIGNDLEKHIEYDLTSHHKLLEYTLLGDQLHGTLRRYQPDGQTLKEVANYKNGIQNGETRFFNPNGSLSQKYTYFNDVLNGPFEIYNDAGFLIKKGNLVNTQLNGEVYYYDDKGTIFCIETYDFGKLQGPFKTFEDGKTMVSGTFLWGYKHGRWDYYWKDAKDYYVAQWLTFNNGTLNGPFKEIHNDSILVGTYKNGVREGEFSIYRPLSLWWLGIPPKNLEDESILCSGKYYNGQKTGTWKSFSAAGTLISEGDYQNDQKQGEWKYYFEQYVDEKFQPLSYSSQLYLKENYVNGKLNGKTERTAYLNLIPVMCDTSIGTVNPLDTCFQLQYRKVHEVTYYKNGELHGPFEWQDADGKLVQKGEFRNGQVSGTWTQIELDLLDTTRSYRVEANFSDGKLNGRFEKYDALTSAILTDGNYVQGQKAGIWKEYHPDGKKVNIITVYENGQKSTERNYTYGGELYLYATYKDGFMTKIEEYNTGKNQMSAIFNILTFKDGKYSLDLTQFSDTTTTSRIMYSPGYKEPEDDPFFFVHTYDFLYKKDPGNIVFEGPHSSKLTNGKVLETGDYHNGTLQGEWKHYFHDQNVVIVMQFEEGERKGEQYVRIDSSKPYSGKLTIQLPEENYLVIKIKKGLRDGPTQKYDRNGKLLKKTIYKAGIKQE